MSGEHQDGSGKSRTAPTATGWFPFKMMAFCNTSGGSRKPARPLCLLLFIAAQCSYSTANLNKCLSKLCENNATCEPHSETYVCHCPDAPVPFTGKNCKELYDVCTSYPCLHNATCNSVLGTIDFSCDCPPGQIGPSCETYLGKCANTSCMNGAICLDEAAGSSCVCPPGYTGANCETNVNECASSPCENGAVCKDKIDGFLCFCVPGYQGRRCEIEVDECASEPCRNEARCMNEIDKYICACPPGLTGTNCELEINECLSQPCLNEATCHNHFASYSCTCAPGFKGRDCEINLDECASQPCQNGGQCTDKVNGYSCDCVNSQFTGVHCDIYVPACFSHPCLNNATCQDNIGNYTCHCWTGFTGTHCEIDIHECFSNPCLHGGECIELSWKNMYGIGSELPAVFSYEHAAGYICKCQHGFTGSHCEMDVNECDSNPCQNGGTCQNTMESYICHCPARNEQELFYGGKNCTDILTGCENHECQNGATCIPYLKDAQHRHNCLCANGYTGLNCQLSTTFSFEVSGYLSVKTASASKHEESMDKPLYSVFLRCSTVLSSSIIFHRGNKDTFMKLEILNGHLFASLKVRNQLVADLEILKNVSDGDWHTAKVTLGSDFSVKLLDNPCSEECMIKRFVGLETEQLASAFENTIFGGTDIERGHFSEVTNIIQPQPYFIGCLQDVEIDSQRINITNLSVQSTLNVKLGCNKNDWCQRKPCQSKGQCIDLWLSYKCECFRPYIGFNCSEELISGRFGHQDSKGYAMFTIDDNPGEEVEISMFIRTQKPNGLLLVLKHNHTPYLQIGLDTGKIVVQTHLSKPLIGGHFTPDSPFHLITVKIKRNSLELVQDGQVVGHTHILPIRVQAGDALFVGGLPDRLESAHDRRNFKGCIQDLKMNNKRLEFYPIGFSEDSYSNRTLVNVTVGCNDDNACKLNPCLNGGTCSSIWDDFVCKCPPNTSGKTCTWVKWCQLNPCPLYTECQLLTDGFDCLVNATFNGRKSDLVFRGNGKIKRELTNITFSFRTRDSNAVILHAEKEQDFITIAIQQCHLIFTMQSGNSLGNLSILSSRAISDGFWHDVTLYIIDPFLQYSRWQMVIDKKEEMVTSTVISGNLNFLLEGTDIYLGSGGPKKGGSLAGCLNTLKLGGISLPYFANDNMHIIQPQQEQFIKISSSPIIMGCPTKNICVSNPCKNNGSCEDMVSYYHCNCAAGWTGLNCDVNINECESGPCIHGNCTDKVSAYKCTCKSGFKGTNCEINIDNCWKHKCANGATCIDAINSYTCSCPDNFTGRFCEYPRLSATFCTEEKKNWTCYNGGNCTNGKTTRCICPIGFTGNKCEVDIDECESDPCLNGGFCQNLPNRFHCICDMSFAGDRCEFDTTPPPNTVNIAAIVAPCVIGGVIVLAVILTFLIVKVREKRQTEGNYSPSSQEQTGSRMEMNNTLKLPPEERLI
ncbi:protein crumbs homolog 1 isoform X1 [Chiloscyllium plagiosum]|uniref:protein crumbs homolog 1 isoform X1 n=1 Tax=Chiloscyllium plagiosum TaxID=36176 RepID=UPI001CB7E762|nr:protein crumbs homolog 1 isoform X1 [Chiloscyllium plagiosum]